MQVSAPHRQVVKVISDNATMTQECRQVARRLRELLPRRLHTIQTRYRQQSHGSIARATRLALVDREYTCFIDELLTMRHDALEARIQYETHLMLLAARQSLRAFHRAP